MLLEVIRIENEKKSIHIQLHLEDQDDCVVVFKKELVFVLSCANPFFEIYIFPKTKEVLISEIRGEEILPSTINLAIMRIIYIVLFLFYCFCFVFFFFI